MKIKFGIGALLAAMLFLSMAFVPAVSGYIERNSDQDVLLENGISYTDAELQDLYRKYNINENDLKFAKNELPNYLEGTILCSDVRVIASEIGEPPEGLKEGEHYDVVITTEEMLTIIDEARNRYIEKYSVNPANPKIDIVEGYALPVEEVKKRVEKGDLFRGTKSPAIESLASMGVLSVSSNPYAINGDIDEHIFIASDYRHTPTESFSQDTINALDRFENFGVNVYRFWYWNSWDASDVSPSYNASDALHDLKEDKSWVRYSASDIVLGWAHDLNHNGIAFTSGAYAICTDTNSGGVDWPHDSIVQHEVSHNFDANDQNSLLHPDCIMNYLDAYQGTNVWCTSCWNTVDNGIDT